MNLKLICACLRARARARVCGYDTVCVRARVRVRVCACAGACTCTCVCAWVRVRVRVTGGLAILAAQCHAPSHDRDLVTCVEHLTSLRQVGRVLPCDRRTQEHKRYISPRHVPVTPAGASIINVAVIFRAHDDAAR